MVVNSKNGYLIEKENSSEIADRVITLLSKQRMRVRMGEESRKQFMNRFTEDIYIKGLENVFVTVTKRAS
jgi:glycosyltransferase involved in cell wall biosynthesis